LDAETEARINAEVQRILQAENQLEALKPHFVVVGEDDNKRTIYVLLSFSKYCEIDKKAILLLKGTEGGGKTTLVSNLTAPFKTEVGCFTEHALKYSDLRRYEILFLKELGSMDPEKQSVTVIKFLSADDRGFVVEYTVRDKNGRFRTEQKRIPAMTIISTATRLVLDSQFERRVWIFNVDKSEEMDSLVINWVIVIDKACELIKEYITRIISDQLLGSLRSKTATRTLKPAIRC